MDFKWDVVIDTDPVVPCLVSFPLKLYIFFNCGVGCDTVGEKISLFDFLQIRSEKAKDQKEHSKAKQKTAVKAPSALASRQQVSSPTPSLTQSSNSSPSSSTASSSRQVDQRTFADAALRMIAEDMLPLR